jgi:ribonuclease J
MKINVIRGQNQIGGSIIEISTEYTRVIFDIGINLDEQSNIEVPQIEGLFCGEPSYSAVFVSHYHYDHIGLLEYVLDGIPIYIGKQAYDISRAAVEYCGKTFDIKHLDFTDGSVIEIGDLKITAFRCDHSAFDSYMFLIENAEKEVLYTGDFRANGHLNYNELLERLPEVDALIIEGTMLSRDTFDKNIEEEFLEEIAVDVLSKYSGPAFLLSSAMNVDRIITAYNAARVTGRVFLEDLYTAGIMSAIGMEVPAPGNEGIKVFMTGGDKQYELLKRYEDCKIGKAGIARSRFLMCVRPSMKNYLSKLSEDCSFENGIIFYSMWKGYQAREDMKSFLEWMKSKGVKVHVLHTSGHADTSTIEALVNKVNPKVIVPVHTEEPSWYLRFGRKVLLEESTISF